MPANSPGIPDIRRSVLNLQHAGRPELNRRVNISLALDLIKRKGPLSRADLVRLTGLRAPSVSAIVQGMLDEKLILEMGLGQSTGGRQPTLLEVNPSGLHAVGVEIQKDGLHGMIVNFVDDVLAQSTCTLPDTEPETVVERITSLVDELCKRVALSRDSLAGIGIALPGIVSRCETTVILSRALGWKNVPFRDKVSSRLGLNVKVLNNAVTGALAAYFDRDRPHVRSLLFILISLRKPTHGDTTTVQCGIVLDGRAYLGDGHMAGDIREGLIHPMAAAQDLWGKDAPPTFDALLQCSQWDSDRYSGVWDWFANHLGRVVARAIDFLNPGRVVIGTDVQAAEELMGKTVRQTAHANTLEHVVAGFAPPEMAEPVPIEFTTITSESTARGAIAPVLHELSLAPFPGGAMVQ